MQTLAATSNIEKRCADDAVLNDPAKRIFTNFLMIIMEKEGSVLVSDSDLEDRLSRITPTTSWSKPSEPVKSPR